MPSQIQPKPESKPVIRLRILLADLFQDEQDAQPDPQKKINGGFRNTGEP